MFVTAEECKSKWRNIRDNYIKNKKKKIAGGSSSYSKYDDERLNFLSDSYDDGNDGIDETSCTSNQETAATEPLEVTFECVKEEYDSSEDVPLSQSPFMMGISRSSTSEQPGAYPPALVAASYDANATGLAPLQHLPGQETVTPPPKRAMKRKIDSIIEELKKDREERNVILQQLVIKATSPAGQSPIHNFFSSMADIVCHFPPDKIAEVRLKVCSLISEMELSVLKDKSQFGGKF